MAAAKALPWDHVMLVNREPRTFAAELAPALVFLGAWLYRFLSVPSFHNDQFMHLAWANQVLGGELPVRDFVDPGMPLTYLVSAAAQVVLGRTLLAEGILCLTFLALGAALTYVLAARASGSAIGGMLAALVLVLIAPRLYSYPKIVLPLWAAWLFSRYAVRPAFGTLGWMAAATAVAFLMRHDHGFYIGLAALVLLVAVHAPDGVAVGSRRAWQFTGAVVVALLPFLLFVHLNGGLSAYFRVGLEFTRSEEEGRRLVQWPDFDVSPPVLAVPQIVVRWGADVDAETRARLEVEHDVVNSRQIGPQRWRYDLLDVSPANIRALVNRPEIEDTAGIDRSASQVIGFSRTTPDRLASAMADLGVPGAARLLKRSNAVAWLYAVLVLLPFVGVVGLVATWRAVRATSRLGVRTPAFVVSLAVLCAATNYGYLRDPIAVRLSDASAVTMVLAAWLIGLARPALRWRRLAADGSRPPVTWPRVLAVASAWALVVLCAAATLLAAADLGDLGRRIDRAHLNESVDRIAQRAARTVRELGARPPIDGWIASGDERAELKQIAQFVRTCTASSDHLLVTWFEPELYYYTERRFAAGLAFFYPGYFTAPAEQQQALSRLRSQSVPVAIVEAGRYDQSFRADQPLLAAHLDERYQVSGELAGHNGDRFRVLTAKTAVPVRSYEPLALPCFR